VRIPYFPGCTLSTKAQGCDLAGRASAKALGFELAELPQWNCCGATFPLAVDNELAMVGPTRILIDAQKQGTRLLTLCSICYNVLKRTNTFLQKNEDKRERINLFVEEEYGGEVQVLHLLELLRDELGFETSREHVVSNLEGLHVAPYYGCLLLRPQDEIGLDDPDEPTILHDLLGSLGCEVVDFPNKTECCGSYLTVSAADAAEELAYTILRSALDEGAEMVVTSCPLCQFNLDYRQGKMASRTYSVRGTTSVRRFVALRPVPILYFTQLLGIALGLDTTDYGFQEHYVDPRPLLAGKGLIVPA
jgi:heterodisulfide reductase subunit B